jgi:hypothetical protein
MKAKITNIINQVLLGKMTINQGVNDLSDYIENETEKEIIKGVLLGLKLAKDYLPEGSDHTYLFEMEILYKEELNKLE